MYQTTTENGKYTFVIDGDVPKIYYNNQLWDQGGIPLLTLLQKVEKYEKALIEIVNQRELASFLEENDWAIPEDYFAQLAKEALKNK